MTEYQPRFRKALALLLLCGAVALPPVAFASSTGLNNIPTADTPGDREVVFQWFSTVPTEGNANHWAGLKGGLRPFGDMHRFEYGADARLAPGKSGPVVLQGKYALKPWEESPALLGIGVANLALRSEDRDRAGQPFYFGMLAYELPWLRAHAGYGFQRDNNTVLLGLDHTLQLFERDLMLRVDALQIDDRDQWLGSLGFLYVLHKHVAVESWVSQPFDHGPTSFTFKLDLIFKF